VQSNFTTEGARPLLGITLIPRLPCTALGLEVECAPAVLPFVCKEAAVGARSLAKGGLEVGGVLFGTHEDGLIRILAARPIECEHRLGPSFVLSDKDEVQLEQMLADSKLDRELSLLQPLGCYLSHSRHGAALTDSDVQLLNRHFAATCQLVLILVPHLPVAINVSFLARDAQGAHAAFHEFEYSILNLPKVEMGTGRQNVTRPPLNRASTVVKLDCEVGPAKPSLVSPVTLDREVVPTKPLPVSPVAVTRQRAPEHFRRRPGTLLLAVVVLAVLCAPRRDVIALPVSLSFSERGGILTIHWDPALAAIRQASQGALDIEDGEAAAVHIALDPAVLRKGWIQYARKTEIVRASFSLAAKGIMALENAVYVSPIRKPPLSVERKATQPLVESVVSPLAAIKSAPTDYAVNPADTEPQVEIRKPIPRRFRAPLVGAPSSTNSAPWTLPDPPALVEQAVMPSSTLPTLSLPAPVSNPVPPASGRLIWTGQLAKHAVLSLSARGASSGYIDGWIPSKTPVHVEVRPGELIEGGIMIFTKEGNSRSESPSVLNGWNTVLYKQDIARASELEVVEAPGSANEWNQLVLRNSDRRLSLIVVDWRSTKSAKP